MKFLVIELLTCNALKLIDDILQLCFDVAGLVGSVIPVRIIWNIEEQKRNVKIVREILVPLDNRCANVVANTEKIRCWHIKPETKVFLTLNKAEINTSIRAQVH